MKELLTALILWLSVGFDLPATSEHPTIRFETPDTMMSIRYDGGKAGFANVVALYDGGSETIYLSEGWDRGDPVDVSVLVHELVHHLQQQAGLNYPCPQAREALAYEAQAQWLAMFGTTLEEEFQTNPLALKLRTSCMAP
jgi:hypothetical protein